MALTLLMTAVLIITFMLMFGLVKFSEIIITRQETVEPGESAVDSTAINRELPMAVYVLTALVVLLVIYLFYAVINPQKF
jgi:K+-transporting ATPase KdpF subunit